MLEQVVRPSARGSVRKKLSWRSTSAMLSLPAVTVRVDAVGGVGEREEAISEGVIVAAVGADVVKAEVISVVAEAALGVVVVEVVAVVVRRSMSRTLMLSQA